MLRLFATLLWVLAATTAHALSITPITLEMKTAGATSRTTITVTNPSGNAIAIEPTFDRVTLSDNGAVSRAETEGEHFLLMPLQALIQPGASQTFRLQWVGPPDIPQSESYFITFNQLPLEKTSSTGLTLLAAFSVAVNVNPVGATPTVSLVNTGIDKSSGTPRPLITVQNPTPAHALLKHATITVLADGVPLELQSHAFEQAYGNGLLQPWARRTFVLPLDLPHGTAAVSATVDYRPPAQ